MIIKARKKPVVIEAVQLKENYDSIRECLSFLGRIYEEYTETSINNRIAEVNQNNGIEIFTSDGGAYHANFGDYIIKDTEGQFHPYNQDMFEKMYNIDSENKDDSSTDFTELKIICKGGITKVYRNGEEMKDVMAIKFEHEADRVPTYTIRFIG